MRKSVSNIAIIICLIVFFYSAFQLYQIYQDYHRAAQEYSQLEKRVLTTEDVKVQDDQSTGDQEERPFNYALDFEQLKSKNEDAAGWIILPDSKINYPIVKSEDNTEYLTKTFEGKTASSGAIFMDQDSEADFSGQITVIYGHNMKDGSMFHALNRMEERDFFDGHQRFWIYTGEKFEEFQVISAYSTTTEDADAWRLSFSEQKDYEAWIKRIVKKSVYQGASCDSRKNTITLSTCRGNAGGVQRMIVHLQQV